MIEATTPRARSARREGTRQRILDAAREVFAERGVFGGTVEEIGERAGFTRGAFYSNFADKADVLDALIEREHARLLAHIDANFGLVEPAGTERTADARRRMAAIVDRLLAAVPMDRQFALIQAELEIHALRDPAGSRAFRDAEARFRGRIADYLERGMERLGRELTADRGTVTDAVIAIVEGTAYRALAEGRPDPNAVARDMLPALLTAVTKPRARRSLAAD